MKEAVKAFFSDDIVKRALKTFIQAFLATLAVGVATVNDFESAKALLVGALAAAISAAWNTLKK
jgi:hypothetical protein